MSIKHTQVLERDTLNRAFVSKSATGTQIMAGSLRLLGNIQIDGTATFKALNTGIINAGSSTISTTGNISAGTFSGNGASLTSLNAANLGSGTVPTSRLPSTLFYTNTQQTITSNTTMNANLYLANGTSYYISSAADAKVRNLETTGTVNLNSDVKTGNKLTIGHASSSYSARWELSYMNTSTLSAEWGLNIRDVSNNDDIIFLERVAGAGNIVLNGVVNAKHGMIVSKDLEVYGEVKTGGANEFPDPLVASKALTHWPQSAGGSYAADIQVPSETGAVNSIKITATTARGYLYSGVNHKVLPAEWITFSAYAFATTSSKQGRMTIRWKDSAGAEVGRTDIFHNLTTAWKRYRATGQAPATATQFDVAISAEVSGTIVYWSAFQVERGRAMTAFKPFTGGAGGASLMGNHLKLGVNGEIHSAKNDNYIIKDHDNGNVTLSAAGGNLYLGHQNTSSVFLSSNLTKTDGTKIVDTGGKLYYEGSDTDGRYLKLTGDTVTGATTFSGKLNATGGGYYVGSHIFNTALSAEPVIISRSSSTGEALHIGVSDNVATIDYKNDETTSQVLFKISDASGTYNPLTFSSVGTGVKVGVGVTSPTEALDVSGNLNIAGNVYFNNNMLVANNSSTTNIDHIWYDDSGAHSNSTIGTWNFVADAAAKTSGNAGMRFGSFYADGSGDNYISSNLRIGVLTNSDLPRLSVAGGGFFMDTVTGAGDFVASGSNFNVNAPDLIGSWARGLNFKSSDGSVLHGGVGVYGSGTAASRIYMGFGATPYASSTAMHMLPSGRIGIGSTSPSDKLQIEVPAGGTAMTGRAAYGGIHLNQTGGADNFVGITTSSQSSGTQGGILFQGSGAYGTKIHFMTTNSFSNGQYHRMVLDHSGNLGIGTESPSQKLHVVGTAQATTLTATSDVNAVNANLSGNLNLTGSSGVYFGHGGGWNMSDTTWIRSTGGKSIYMASGTFRTDGTLQVGPSPANGLVVTSAALNWKSGSLYAATTGKVSINQERNTEHPLHVKSDGSYMGINIQSTADTDISGISFQRPYVSSAAPGNYTWHMASASGISPDLVFYSGNSTSMSALSEKMRITNSGNVGIGRTSPAYKLDVNGAVMTQDLHISHPENAASRMSLAYTNVHGFTGSAWGYVTKDTLNNVDRVWIEQTASLARMVMNGYLGIGGTGMPNTSYRLDVYGSAQVQGNLKVSGNIQFSDDSTAGNIVFTDSNTMARANVYSGADGFTMQADGAPTNTVVKSGHFDAEGSVYAGTKVAVNKFAMEYNTTEDSLDFVYYG